MGIMTADITLVATCHWQDPTPLQRIWCLYEMWRSLAMQKTIRMGFPKEEAVNFSLAVQSTEADVEALVQAKVDVQTAKATVNADKEMIQSKIAESIGQSAFNLAIRKKLMAHLVPCAIHTDASSASL